ncbi:hypothetical protein ACJX0J_012582, partial [Zea mays]
MTSNTGNCPGKKHTDPTNMWLVHINKTKSGEHTARWQNEENLLLVKFNITCSFVWLAIKFIHEFCHAHLITTCLPKLRMQYIVFDKNQFQSSTCLLQSYQYTIANG